MTIEKKEEHYMYELVTPSQKHFDRLMELQKEYPELTYDNKGYETLSKEIQERHTEVIKEIESILKASLKGFSEFQNFKPRQNDNFHIRSQHKWNDYFTGVGYFDIRYWNPEKHGKH